ncbi:hypothetical protein GQ53DRAFT_423376 [Thozetella sp. PMI_491]|nr:hypothetical protein GQ53DRAFT_423376 [Thozetella sp. PMI_491]
MLAFLPFFFLSFWAFGGWGVGMKDTGPCSTVHLSACLGSSRRTFRITQQLRATDERAGPAAVKPTRSHSADDLDAPIVGSLSCPPIQVLRTGRDGQHRADMERWKGPTEQLLSCSLHPHPGGLAGGRPSAASACSFSGSRPVSRWQAPGGRHELGGDGLGPTRFSPVIGRSLEGDASAETGRDGVRTERKIRAWRLTIAGRCSARCGRECWKPALHTGTVRARLNSRQPMRHGTPTGHGDWAAPGLRRLRNFDAQHGRLGGSS